MSDLAKHIEILLLDNDCVIVPGFGGFMAHRVDSVYVEEEGIFLPPSRTLGFNPQLHVNDSLLAQSYVEALDISYPEALRHIENDVREIKQTLSNEGRYELPDIGELVVNNEGNYVFTPCTSGVLTPGLYALNSFEMPKLAKTNVVETVAAKPEEKKPKAKILQLNTELTRNIAAAAAILLILVFGIMPVGDSSKTTQQLCAIDTSLLQQMMPQMRTTTTEEINPVKVENDVVIETQLTESDVTETEEIAKPADEKVFVVVLASGVSRKNAESFISGLDAEEVEGARIVSKGTTNYIVCGAFDTRDDAQQKANEMRNSSSQFADVWVMETKN